MLHHAFKFLAGMESYHTACGNRHFFAGFRVTARALRFVAQLEIAETGNFNFFATRQSAADFFKKELDDFFGIILVTLLTLSTKISANSALVSVMCLPSFKLVQLLPKFF